MSDRPPKLPPIAVNVVWGSTTLTLGEKVVWYQDWVLDQGGPDGSYISHTSMEARLGRSLTAGSIETIRQHLKRLTLHEPIRRRDARNLGWISTLPPQCMPRTYRDAPACSVALDNFLRKLKEWSGQDRTPIPDRVEPRFQTGQNGEAAALGGRGETPSQDSVRQAQLPSAVKEEKRVVAHATDEKRDRGDGARPERLSVAHLREACDAIDARQGKQAGAR